MTASDDDTAMEPTGPEPVEPPVPVPAGDEDDEQIDWFRLLFVGGVLLILLVGAVYAWTRFVENLNSPEAAVAKMMDAYGSYDAQGLLDATTHYSITRDAEATFIDQSKKAKERAGGKPLVRNVEVVSVESRGKDQALVRVTAEWLVDPAKGTYRKQTQPVPVVRKEGVWIVQMF